MSVQSLRVADDVIDSVWTILNRMGWNSQRVYIPIYNCWAVCVNLPADELFLFNDIFGDTLSSVVDWVL